MRDNSANITSEPVEQSFLHLISATNGVSADSGVQQPGRLSHAPDEGPSITSHDAAAQALPSTYSLPTSSHHSLLFSDVDTPVESPSQEPDETDVLNALLSDGHAAHLTGAVESFSSAAAAAVPAWIRSRSGTGSYSSYRSWRPSQDGSRSVNPVYEVAESLRSVDSLGLGSEAASLSSSPVRRDMMEDGDLVMGEQDGRDGGEQRPPPPPRQDNTMDSSLPGDDGMRALRVKLHEIRTLAASTEEKARRMHRLMVRDYEAHQANKPAIPSTDMETGGTFEGPVDPRNPYRMQDADLEASFSPLPVRPREPDGDRDESMVDDITITLGCAHYKRNVKVQCFDCRLWFTCRHCHDQSPTLPFPHRLNRKKTQNMLCMLCRTPQPAGELCINCGEYAAWYYCPKCKLWDNDNNKRIYHCDDCGICRVGEGLGKDYVHCRRCNVCISISTSASHPCIERATEGDCPLCLVRLFESPTPVVSLPCGHYMHGECYRDLMAVTYKCPVCSRSAVNMELQWRKLDDEIRAQPMPEDDEDLEGLLPHAASIAAGDDDLAPPTSGHVSPASQPRRPRTVYIGCNDCGRRSWAPFHWLGLKCQVCDSYNTNQMAPTVVQETEAERLIRQQAQHHRQHDFTGNSVLRDAGIGADDAAVEDVLLDVNTATLQVPTSPSQVPVNSERRASGAQSPGRRYFVQQEEERRPSFTMTPRFPTPSLPNLPNLPNLPDMPRLPRMPHMPNMPNMPNIPNLELGRFSPYEMLDAMSRSLSPMRYYLQGLDVGEGGPSHRSGGSATEGGGRNRSPTSVRSDPTGVSRRVSSGKRRAGEGEAGDWLWGEESDGDSEEDGDGGEGTDGSIRAVRRGEGEGETSEEESSSGSSEEDQGDGDAEMVDEDGDGEEEEDEEMELFGHR